MAELNKIEDLEIGIPLVETPSKEIEVPIVLPQKRSKRVSALEKMTIFSLIVAFIALAIGTVSLATDVTKTMEDISQVQQDKVETTEEINRLEQEKNELLKVDRIKEIAEKAGLETIEGNIRTVTK